MGTLSFFFFNPNFFFFFFLASFDRASQLLSTVGSHVI